MAYIYKITNDINDKVYIGKTTYTIEKRFQEHCRDASRKRNEKRPLYDAMNKYGIEHFHIEEIEKVKEIDKLEEREKYWIEMYGSFKSGYNATKGGDGKEYLDYDLIYKTYLSVKNIRTVAEYCHCDTHSVSKILNHFGISNEIIHKNAALAISKPVAKLDKDTLEVLEVYSSAVEAERLNGNTKHINDVCKGKRKTCKGYKWKYL